MCASHPQFLAQDLSRSQVEALQGETVTLAGWVRLESQNEAISEVTVDDGQVPITTTVSLSSEWTFYALTATVNAQSTALQAQLPSSQAEGAVCHDGVVMAQGEFPVDEPPQFSDPTGKSGVWAGHPFVNLLSNGSGERVWPRFKPWASQLIRGSGLTRNIDPTLFVQSILDWKRTGWVYGVVWTTIWQSFWARFGWNHVAMPRYIYLGLSVCTWLGLGGMVVYGLDCFVFPSRLESWQRRASTCFVLSVFLVWANAMVWYSHPHLLNLERIYYAVARYVYPTVIPTVLFLYLGWRALIPRSWRPFLPIVSILGFVCLDVAALMGTILPFYYLT
jgi:hypothetical protein